MRFPPRRGTTRDQPSCFTMVRSFLSVARWRHSVRPSVSLALGLLVRTSPSRIGARPGRWGVFLVFLAACVFYCCGGGGGLRGHLTYPRLWCQPDGFPVFIATLPFTRTAHDGSGSWTFPSLLFFSQLDLFALPPSNPAHRKGGHRSGRWNYNGARRGWGWRGSRLRGGLGVCAWPCHWRLCWLRLY